MIGALIIGCEIAFWIFVLSGLSARYIFGWKKAGGILLLCTPAIDLLLIAVTVIDLKNGSKAELVHGLAAIYIGVTIAFGHRMIKWTDQRFAHRFAGGPRPETRPKYGKNRAQWERQGWYRHLLAWVLGALLLVGMVMIVGDASRTKELERIAFGWAGVVVIDFVISFSYTLWPKKEAREG
ncbi:hypothetical protein MNQ98_00380 [Paenibacillus sp. N3/727]|uniref:hypothetical protein n=1 Tax=Paenibacillus sp. N3/727 TaxID=2925845 RepID=UPI001F52FD53|nr:hypothetical protein [Paenibacillus sp. N3/727]UNK18560.1 hypothetical protein MNQ98_00380 [Paenibacillus sp. N3/727]